MNNVFASRFITFENKRIIFNNITELPKYKKYKQEKLNNIHAKLEKFNKHRNALAHYVLDVKQSSLNKFKETGEVTFMKFEKGIEYQTYTVTSATKIANEIHEFIIPLVALINMQ